MKANLPFILSIILLKLFAAEKTISNGDFNSLIDALGGTQCAELLHHLDSSQWLYSNQNTPKTGIRPFRLLTCDWNGCTYFAQSSGGCKTCSNDSVQLSCPFSSFETEDVSTSGQILKVKLMWDLKNDQQPEELSDGPILFDELQGYLALRRSDRTSMLQLHGVLMGVGARPTQSNSLIYIPLTESNEYWIKKQFSESEVELFLQGFVYENCEHVPWHKLASPLEENKRVNNMIHSPNLNTALQWIDDAASSLDKMHNNGLYHGESNDQNMFLCNRKSTSYSSSRMVNVYGSSGIMYQDYSNPLSGSWKYFVDGRHNDNVKLAISIVELLTGEQLPNLIQTEFFQANGPQKARCIFLNVSRATKICRKEEFRSEIFTKLKPISELYFASVSHGLKSVHWAYYIGRLLVNIAFSSDTWTAIHTRRYVAAFRRCIAHFDSAYENPSQIFETFAMLPSGILTIVRIDSYNGLSIFQSDTRTIEYIPLHNIPCMNTLNCMSGSMKDSSYCIKLEASSKNVTMCFTSEEKARICLRYLTLWGKCGPTNV